MKIRHQFRVCVSTGVLEDWGTCAVSCQYWHLSLSDLSLSDLSLYSRHTGLQHVWCWPVENISSQKLNIFLLRCIKKMEHCYHCNAIQYQVSLWSLDIFVCYHISIFFFLHFFASNVMLGLKSQPYNGNQLPAWGWTFFYRPGQYVCSCVGVWFIPWIIIYLWI